MEVYPPPTPYQICKIEELRKVGPKDVMAISARMRPANCSNGAISPRVLRPYTMPVELERRCGGGGKMLLQKKRPSYSLAVAGRSACV